MQYNYIPGLQVRKYNLDNGFLLFSNSEVELQRVLNELPTTYTTDGIQRSLTNYLTEPMPIFYIKVMAEFSANEEDK